MLSSTGSLLPLPCFELVSSIGTILRLFFPLFFHLYSISQLTSTLSKVSGSIEFVLSASLDALARFIPSSLTFHFSLAFAFSSLRSETEV